MPIYHQQPNVKLLPFNYQRFMRLDRVPTASVLIRVSKDHQAVTKLKAKAPPSQLLETPIYKEGVYNTGYFNLTEDERDIMKLRRLYKDPMMVDIVKYIAF